MHYLYAVISIILMFSVWDSSAKLQSGLLTGNLNSLGNFDECVSITDVQNLTGSFSGQHCLATFYPLNTSASDAMGQTLKQLMEDEENINIGVRESDKCRQTIGTHFKTFGLTKSVELNSSLSS